MPVANRGRAAGAGISGGGGAAMAVPLNETESKVTLGTNPLSEIRKNVTLPTSVLLLGDGLSGCQVTLNVHEVMVAEQPGAREVVDMLGMRGLVSVGKAANVFPELRVYEAVSDSVTESPTVTVPKSKLGAENVIVSAAAGVRVRAVKENSTAADAHSTSRWFLI
jgi:hypothetical protein